MEDPYKSDSSGGGSDSNSVLAGMRNHRSFEKWAWSYHEPDPADTDGLLGFGPANPAMCLRALAAAPLLAWGQVNKVGDSRGSLRASLACVIQLCWIPRKMLAGQGNVYACAVV